MTSPRRLPQLGNKFSKKGDESDEGFVDGDLAEDPQSEGERRERLLGLLRTLLTPRRGSDPKLDFPELFELNGLMANPDQILDSSVISSARVEALEKVLTDLLVRIESDAMELNRLRMEIRKQGLELVHDGLPDVFNLKSDRDPLRKARIAIQVGRLMEANYFLNVSAEERHRRGCIYHIPLIDPSDHKKGINVEMVEKRIEESDFFLVMVDDQNNLMGFVEVTRGKPGLHPSDSEGRPTMDKKYLNEPLWNIFIGYSPSDILHEQLIVTNAGLTTPDGKPMKGIGTKLLKAMFTQMLLSGAHICTTEVQNEPPNNNSLGLHSKHYPFHLATVKEPLRDNVAEHDSTVSFTVFLKPLSSKAAKAIEEGLRSEPAKPSSEVNP